MYRKLLLVCVTLLYLYVCATAQNANKRIPVTKFSCSGRPSGYYADMDTGCQVYHMCDGIGRQFSYSCPNTTLFQQRMLVCDHWYMVNCSMSEQAYSANLLIGQRDKPFVTDEEMGQRTPRPDILSVPPNSQFIDGLKEAESKFTIHPGNSIVGIADSLSSKDNNGLDSAKHNFRPPTKWSTKKSAVEVEDNIAGSASERPEVVITTEQAPSNSKVTPPSRVLVPPNTPATTEDDDEEVKIDVRMDKGNEDSVVLFIKRFDPTLPDSIKTSMTLPEIIDINKQLPEGQISSEDDRTPKKNRDFGNNANKVESVGKGVEQNRNVNLNEKPITTTTETNNGVPPLDVVLVPPKRDYSDPPSTTVGPPIYYEWKWAVPAFDLEPPKTGNDSYVNITEPQTQGKSPFRTVTRPTRLSDEDSTPEPKNVAYNSSSYFVPDYLFPLDKPHPGYEEKDAQTSFQVKLNDRSGRSSFGENPDCPHCHPAYLSPGSCEPCIKR